MDARLLTIALLALSPAPSLAQPAAAADDDARRWKNEFHLKPVAIDSTATTSATLGLDYRYVGTYSRPPLKRTAVGADEFTVDDFAGKTLTYAKGEVLANGSLVASKAKSPNKLIELRADGLYVRDSRAVTLQGGFVGKFETDQGLDDRQLMYGVTAAATRFGLLGKRGDIGSAILSFGTVDPSRDAERKRLLGRLEAYQRWELELTYSRPVNGVEWLRSIDLGGRAFKEVGAPDAIRRAGLHDHTWGVLRLNLKQPYFIQYSGGSLPFDKKSERAIKAGLSLKLD